MELNNLTTTALKTAMLVVLGRDETEDAVCDLIDVIELVAEKGEEVTISELLDLKMALKAKHPIHVDINLEEYEALCRKLYNTGGTGSGSIPPNVHLS